MKKIFQILTALFMLVSLAQAKTLSVGVSPNYPPFEFINDQNKISGFDIDFINEIGKKVGFEVKIVSIDFDALIPALKSGKIDIIASGMSATEQRKKAVDFSAPYYATQNLFIKSRSNSDIASLQSLKGKVVAVQLGTVQELAARKIEGVKVQAMQDIFGAIMSVKNGKADALIVDSSIGYGYLKKNPDLVEFLHLPDGSDGFSFAFDKGKHKKLIAKIDIAIEELKKDGTYDKLLSKYDLK